MSWGKLDSNQRLQRLSLHPGVSLEQVQENSGFEILVPEEVDQNAPPSTEEQRILKEIDPQGLVLGR